MRSLMLTAALSVALCTPAYADRKVCHTSHTVDGVRSEVGAVLEPAFDRMLLTIGPIFAPLEMASGTQFRPAANTSKALQFYMFWYGDANPGADWREPGSVEYKLAGIGLQWPSMENSEGSRAKLMRLQVRLGEASANEVIMMKSADFTSYVGSVIPLAERLSFDHPFDWETIDAPKTGWPTWAGALSKGGSFLFNLQDGANQPLASATLNLPPLTAFNQRAAADIRDFRARVDVNACPSGARTTIQ